MGVPGTTVLGVGGASEDHAQFCRQALFDGHDGGFLRRSRAGCGALDSKPGESLDPAQVGAAPGGGGRKANAGAPGPGAAGGAATTLGQFAGRPAGGWLDGAPTRARLGKEAKQESPCRMARNEDGGLLSAGAVGPECGWAGTAERQGRGQLAGGAAGTGTATALGSNPGRIKPSPAPPVFG